MKSQKGVSSLAGTIILAVILAIVAAILFYSNSLLEEKTNPPQISLQKTAVQGNETAGWKTYTNTQYGFEIKYPVNSTTISNPDPYNDSDKFMIMMSGNSLGDTGSVTIEVDSNKSLNDCKKSGQQTKINGVDFSVESFPDDAMGGQRGIATNYYVFHNDACYALKGLVGWHSVQFSHEATDGLKATQKEIDDENKLIQERKDFVAGVVSTFKFTK